MKKSVSFILAAALLAAGCASDRDHILKVYNWSDYVDETAIPEFEQWYEEQTGEKVKVILQTFDINETMLAKIEKGHEDYDVVCPSDYIIERMLCKDMLLPIDRDFGSTPNYIDQNLSPYIRSCFDKIDGNGKNANDYAVGYMWGTTGIIYNPKYVTDEEASTWDVIRNPKFTDKIFLKDSPRDVYSNIILFLKQKELAEGSVTMDELMRYTSDEDIAAVEAFLKEASALAAGWEADFGKDQMVLERGWVNINWSGDGYWAREQAKDTGVELRYVCPKEGATLFFDGWVIPKYARNPKAAKYWINFLSRPDIVIRNINFVGYVSTSCSPEVLEAFTDESLDPIDLTYFFGEGADSVRVDPVLYPEKSVIDRCTMEHDWGDDTGKLIEMWSRVKGDNAGVLTYIIMGVAVLAIAGAILASRSKKHSRRRKGSRGKRQ